MDMAVYQVHGLVLFQQIPEAVKAPVRPVFRVAHTLRRCMGHHDIHTAGAPQLPAQAADPPAHLPLGILVFAGMIFAAAPQTQDPDAVVDNDMVINTVAALRRNLIIVHIMVTVNI